MKGIILTLILSLTVFITGCGGGGSIGEGTSQDTENISGIALDGYLKNAKVCLDQNDNLKCDEGEAYDITDENGKFELNLPIEELDNHKLVVEAKGGETEDDGILINKNFKLTSLSGKYILHKDIVYISPFTTIAERIIEHNNCSESEAIKTIGKLVDIITGNKTNEEQLFKDYTGDKVFSSLAKKIVEALIEIEQQIRNKLEIDDLNVTEEKKLFAVTLDIILNHLPEVVYDSTDNFISEINNYRDLEDLEKKISKDLSGISILLANNTFYNFVIDWNSETHNNWVGIRKISLENINEIESLLYVFKYDLDDSSTPNLDITVNNLTEIEWEFYYSKKLLLRDGALEIINTDGESEGRIIAVTKANLAGKKIKSNMIFADDFASELDKLKLENFTVSFNNGTMYILIRSLSNGEIKPLYIFDESATQQIINALNSFEEE